MNKSIERMFGTTPVVLAVVIGVASLAIGCWQAKLEHDRVQEAFSDCAVIGAIAVRDADNSYVCVKGTKP